MKRTQILSLLILTMFIGSSCAKQKTSVGQGDPETEFKSCIQLSSKGNHEDAIQCMEMFKARYPKTNLGQEAELKIGDAQMAKKEYLLAAESYNAFLRLYPTHPKADYAYYRAGVAYYKESPKAIDRDQSYLKNAIENLRTVLRRYPGSAYSELSLATLQVAVNRIAKRQFYIGKFYYKKGEYIAAIPRLMEVAEKYPDSGLGDHALYLAIIADLELKKFEDAKGAFGILATKFPKSPYTKKAEGRLLSAAKSK